MRKTFFALLMLSVLSISSVCAGEDFFPLKVGNYWKYRHTAEKDAVFDVKVVKEGQIDGRKAFVLEYSAFARGVFQMFRKVMAVTPSEILLVKDAYFPDGVITEYKPSRIYLRLPLKTGLSWKWKSGGGAESGTAETRKVTAVEKVTTPAGTFRAFRVESIETAGGKETEKVHWYAPGVGLVKFQLRAEEMDETMVLTDYSVK